MSKIRVLMVDDEERFRTVTTRILEKKGFLTSIAANGEEALDKLEERPDVVVLDVRMGTMDGHQALREIKKRNKELPVIMLTGHGDIPSAKQALEEGAWDYLAKPCDIDLLCTKIQGAARRSKIAPGKEKMVRDIMLPIGGYTTINEESSIHDAILALQEVRSSLIATDRLLDRGHRSVLVFDKGGELTGFLSPRDLIRAVQPAYLSVPKPSTADALQYSAIFWQGLFTSRAKELMSIPVKEIMSEDPPRIDAGFNLMEAAVALVNVGRKRLAVMEEGKVVGVLREQELFHEIVDIMSAVDNQRGV